MGTDDRRPRGGLRRVVLWLAALVVVGLALGTIARRTGSVADVRWPPVWSVVTAVCGYAVANLVLVLAWRESVAVWDRRPPLAPAGWIWSASQFARYAFSFAQVPSRVALAGRSGIDAGAAALAGTVELVWVVAIGATTAVLTLPWWLGGDASAAWTFSALAVPVVMVVGVSVAPATSTRALVRVAELPLVRRVGGQVLADAAARSVPSRRRIAGITVLYLLNALLRYGSWLALVVGATGGLGTRDVLRVVGAMAVGNVSGLIAVFAPGGLGVREGVAAAAVAPLLGAGAALGLLAGVRVLELVAELLVTGGFRLTARAPRDAG